jgi:hypothetical protein
MATRRRRGEDGISFEHRGDCRDPERHRHCPGLWRGEVTLGYAEDGKRRKRKVSGQTKAAVVDKLRDLHLQLHKGITPKAGYTHYTVRQAAGDWLASGLDGRSPKTVKKNQNVLEPILGVIGARKLRQLSAADMRQALAATAAGYSTAASASRRSPAWPDTPPPAPPRSSTGGNCGRSSPPAPRSWTSSSQEANPRARPRAAENPHNPAADLRPPDLPARQAMTNQPIWWPSRTVTIRRIAQIQIPAE